MTNWFNYEIQVLDNLNALFVFDDVFGDRCSVKIPHTPDHYIRVGGTASHGSMKAYRGYIVKNKQPFEHCVAISKDRAIQGFSSRPLMINDVVYIIEHLSVISDPMYQIDYFVTPILPNILNLHSMNLNYLHRETDANLCNIYIDPYTRQCRDVEFKPAYQKYVSRLKG